MIDKNLIHKISNYKKNKVDEPAFRVLCESRLDNLKCIIFGDDNNGYKVSVFIEMPGMDGSWYVLYTQRGQERSFKSIDSIKKYLIGFGINQFTVAINKVEATVN